MENTNNRRRQPTSIFPVFPLFNPRNNGHFYESVMHTECHCVIDGSRAPHELWRLEPHWKLSNEALLAVSIENFIESFRHANITPHVVFLQPTQDFGGLMRWQYRTLEDRVRDMEASSWRDTSSMQSRIMFGEIMKARGIHHFCMEGSYETMASYARSIDAFVISESNFLFFADVPRGYLQFKHLPLGRLPHGLMDFVGLTYFRDKFLNSFRCVETDKMKSIALFAVLISPPNAELLKEFSRARIMKPKGRIDGINLPRKTVSGSRLAQCLLFVTDKSYTDARKIIERHMYLNERELFDWIYEDTYEAFAFDENVSGESPDVVPKLTGYIENDYHGDEPLEIDSSDDEESSEEGSDDDSSTDGILPIWFKETVQSEALCGYYGRKLQYMITLLATGCFYPVHHLQDTLDYSACFASLKLRRVLYGIMFQDHRKELQRRGSPHEIEALRIKEYAVIRANLCELRVEPKWNVKDAATEAPQETLELPGLNEMENLDLATRKRIFAVAMVGSSGWLHSLGPDAHEHEYNLLLLKSWAKRSPNLKKIHVIVLLLTILAIEAQYGKRTRVFPWPISFRTGESLRCPPQTARIHYECLQPFAQLQSLSDIAFYLNSALASPHGLRVDRVREFFSEVFFHHLLIDWSLLTETEQAESLSTLFEDDDLGKFSSLVDALYGVEDEPERAPLYSVLSTEGFSSDEIMGNVTRIREIDADEP